MSRRYWTDEQTATLVRLYSTHTAHQISEIVGWPAKAVWMKAARLGLRKPRAAIAERARQCMADPNHPGRATQWGHGRVPWNKGRKGMPASSPATTFKPGTIPHTWKPVGSLRLVEDGILQRKVTDTGYGPRDWVAVHRLVWMEANGPIPDGYIVVFKPGRRTSVLGEITPDALEVITRAENMKRNSVHERYPKAIALAVQARGALNRKINALQGKQDVEKHR